MMLLVFQSKALAQSPSPAAGTLPGPAIELTYPIPDFGDF